MEEVLPKNTHFAQSTTFRKAAFGRTSLFLKTPSALFRDIRAPSAAARQTDASIFHAHIGNNQCVRKPDCACWHCCHAYESEGFRIPRVFDPQEQQYHVYGWFCSANCAKAYILEHSTFDRGYQMNIFVRMLRQVYKIETAIDEAPPRLSLKMFGGPFDIEAFRKETNLCTLVTPPFVSYSMLIEERTPPAHERQDSMTRGTVRGLKRPTQRVASAPTDMGEPAVEGQYAQYLRNKRETSADAPANGSGAPSAVAVDTAPAPATAAAPRRSATGLAKFAKR
jgi:hypothetical protein